MLHTGSALQFLLFIISYPTRKGLFRFSGNYFSETNHYIVTTNYSFTKCKLFLKMNVQSHKKSNLIYDYRNIHHTKLNFFFLFTLRSNIGL